VAKADTVALFGMKAVVLARGLGSRMMQESPSAGLGASGVTLTAAQAAAAAAGAKGLMPIPSASLGAGGARPFLDYVLSALADAGCSSVCLVVAPDHTAIRSYYEGGGRPSRLAIEYAIQPIADGTARAVNSARAYVGRDPFLVLNSDNLYPASVLRALADHAGPALPAYPIDSLVHDSGFPRDRVAGFAAIEVDDRGRLTRIVEKPGREYYDRVGSRALISMNVWRFDERIFEACRDVPLSPRGEYELPEAVGLAVTRGETFQTFLAWGAVLDLSKRPDVAHVTARLAGVEPHP
jgi:dTDP-glucose pyrophosphorylase